MIETDKSKILNNESRAKRLNQAYVNLAVDVIGMCLAQANDAEIGKCIRGIVKDRFSVRIERIIEVKK